MPRPDEPDQRVVRAATRSNAEHEKAWRERNGLEPSGHDPCIRRLALGDCSRPWTGCTCLTLKHDWPGAELLSSRHGEPVVLFTHRPRFDDDDLTKLGPWLERWPQLQLVVTAGSWVDSGSAVVALYHRGAWARVRGREPEADPSSTAIPDAAEA